MSTTTEVPTVNVTVAKFDSGTGLRYENVRDGVPVIEWDPLTDADYQPAGMTPLRDAVVQFIESLATVQAEDRVTVGLLLDESGSMSGNRESVIASANEFVSGMAAVDEVDPESAGKVMAVILTDGGENASREIDAATLKQRIAAREQMGWTFIYLGANQDAWATADYSGFSGTATGQSKNFTSSPVGTRSALRYAGQSVNSYLSNNAQYAAAASASPKETIAEDGSVTSAPAPAPTVSDETRDAIRDAASQISS